jgi:ubiquinone/menaquinone biosynthesis C-methylase UbiE
VSGQVKEEALVMTMSKIGMKQMQRQYFDAVNLGLAQLIKGKTGISKGKCLELNAGVGGLGLTLAEHSLLELYLLVNSPEAWQQTMRYVAERQLTAQVRVLKGSSLKIPLPDREVNLVVSKSSVLLWQNRTAIFREVYRVLAPGGQACLGGGFTPEDLQQRIDAKLDKCYPLVRRQLDIPYWQQQMLELEGVLRRAAIPAYEINYSDRGLWVLMRKTAEVTEVGDAVADYSSASNCPVRERS